MAAISSQTGNPEESYDFLEKVDYFKDWKQAEQAILPEFAAIHKISKLEFKVDRDSTTPEQKLMYQLMDINPTYRPFFAAAAEEAVKSGVYEIREKDLIQTALKYGVKNLQKMLKEAKE
jgi:hypothetical protein